MGQNWHTKPVSANSCDSEDQTEREQTGVFDGSEVHEGENECDTDDHEAIIESRRERPLEEASIEQLFDNRRAECDDHEQQYRRGSASAVDQLFRVLLQTIIGKCSWPDLLERQIHHLHQHELR